MTGTSYTVWLNLGLRLLAVACIADWFKHSSDDMFKFTMDRIIILRVLPSLMGWCLTKS